jgi:hypothetical protein
METINLNKQDQEVFDVRVSVSKELADHYEKVIEMRDRIINSDVSSGQEISSILTTTTNLIKELGKIQKDLYTSEKFAILTQIIVDELREMDPKMCSRVVNRLEARFEEIS